MIKGCSKRVIVVKHPKGDAFEEAYFIIKDGKYKTSRDTKTLVNEANRIINEGKSTTSEDKRALLLTRLGNVLAFVLGMGVSFILFLVLINI